MKKKKFKVYSPDHYPIIITCEGMHIECDGAVVFYNMGKRYKFIFYREYVAIFPIGTTAYEIESVEKI